MDNDAMSEKIYTLRDENAELRARITYLQEELSAVEDTLRDTILTYEDKIEELEQQLGDAPHGYHD